jgi:hypothetical protein
MAKYIQGKNGKMAGSIGDGKTTVPTAAPTPKTELPARLSSAPAGTPFHDHTQNGEVIWNSYGVEDEGTLEAKINGINMIVIIEHIRGSRTDFWKGGLYVETPNGSLNPEPVEEVDYTYEEDIKDWTENKLRERWNEWIDFTTRYAAQGDYERKMRRDAIAAVGKRWRAMDLSHQNQGQPAAQFEFENRITNVFMKDHEYHVVVTRTDYGNEEYPIVQHARTFSNRTRAIDFAEEMTFLGN